MTDTTKPTSIADHLLDFIFLVCPYCRTDENDMTGEVTFRNTIDRNGETPKVVKIAMRCKNGHDWECRVTNMPGTGVTALNCFEKGRA